MRAEAGLRRQCASCLVDDLAALHADSPFKCGYGWKSISKEFDNRVPAGRWQGDPTCADAVAQWRCAIGAAHTGYHRIMSRLAAQHLGIISHMERLFARVQAPGSGQPPGVFRRHVHVFSRRSGFLQVGIKRDAIVKHKAFALPILLGIVHLLEVI